MRNLFSSIPFVFRQSFLSVELFSTIVRDYFTHGKDVSRISKTDVSLAISLHAKQVKKNSNIKYRN